MSSYFRRREFLKKSAGAAVLAQLAGQGKKVEWDGAAMRCTNLPELNQHVRREYRKG